MPVEPSGRRLLLSIALIAPACGAIYWYFRLPGLFGYFRDLYSLGSDGSGWSLSPFLLFPFAFAGIGAAWVLLASILKNSPPAGGLSDASAARSPALLILAGGVVVVLLSPLMTGPGLLMNFLIVGAGVAIWFAACGIGLILLESSWLAIGRDRYISPLEHLVYASALGAGVISLVVLIVGSAGLPGAFFWRMFVAAGCIAGAPRLKRLGKELLGSAASFQERHGAIELAAVVAILFWLALHLPLLWSPPQEYDVLEYHLGAPVEYLHNGRISVLPENIFSAYPENGEMLFTLALSLVGDRYHGLPAAHFMVFAAWMLSIAGVYVLIRRVCGEFLGPPRPGGAAAPAPNPAAALGALLYAFIPQGTEIAADFYVEHLQALLHLSALSAAVIFFSERQAGIRRCKGWLLICGMLCGFCCGTKYTALLFTLAPLILLVPLFCALSGSIYEAAGAVLQIGAPAALVYCPWLIRNLLAAGDPLYPLGIVLRRRLSPQAGPPDRIDHFSAFTRPEGSPLRAIQTYLFAGFDTNMRYWMLAADPGPHVISMALPGFICALFPERKKLSTRWQARPELLIVSFFILDFLIFLFMTARLQRFYFSMAAPLAVICGIGLARLWSSRVLRVFFISFCMFWFAALAPLSLLLVWNCTQTDNAIGLEDPRDAARIQFHQANPTAEEVTFEGWRAINELPEGSRVLLVGDAEVFYLDRIPLYSTVFNTPPLERLLGAASDPDDLAAKFKDAGITHIYINYSEWFRLDTTIAVTRESDGEPWRLAHLPREKTAPMRDALRARELRKYSLLWKGSAVPAYLKLDERQYLILEDFLKEHTAPVWSPQKNNACELRRILTNE